MKFDKYLTELEKDKSFKKADFPNRTPFYAGKTGDTDLKIRNLMKKGYIILAYYNNIKKATPYINGFKKLGLNVEVIEKENGEIQVYHLPKK